MKGFVLKSKTFIPDQSESFPGGAPEDGAAAPERQEDAAGPAALQGPAVPGDPARRQAAALGGRREAEAELRGEGQGDREAIQRPICYAEVGNRCKTFQFSSLTLSITQNELKIHHSS